jgi:hypothetical protein
MVLNKIHAADRIPLDMVGDGYSGVWALLRQGNPEAFRSVKMIPECLGKPLRLAVITADGERHSNRVGSSLNRHTCRKRQCSY